MRLVKLLGVAGVYFCIFAFNSGWLKGNTAEKGLSQYVQNTQTYIIPLMKINGIQVRPEDLMESP